MWPKLSERECKAVLSRDHSCNNPIQKRTKTYISLLSPHQNMTLDPEVTVGARFHLTHLCPIHVLSRGMALYSESMT